MTYRERKRAGLVRPRPPAVAPPIRHWVWEVYRRRCATQVELARFLAVSQSTVHRIVSDQPG